MKECGDGCINTNPANGCSVEEGSGTVASGFASHAEGLDTQANGAAAHAEGGQTQANGLFSHAKGESTIARARASHAEGNQTQANFTASHAEGFQSTTNAYASHAEGGKTQTNGLFSHAEGESTTASGRASHAEGFRTTTSGRASHAEGINTLASGVASHAEGQETQATAPQAHAEGFQTIASGVNSHAEGIGTQAIGNFSHAEGFLVQAIGIGSHAEGQGTLTTARQAHAEGSQTLASGVASHAEGKSTRASGDASHAEGQSTQASAPRAHAEGLETIASGGASHAEGMRTLASGVTSHAQGFMSKASGDSAHAEGLRNEALATASHVEGMDNSATHIGSHIMGQNGVTRFPFSWHLANGLNVGPTLNSAVIHGATGNLYLDGAVIAPAAADYAEMFETVDGNAIDPGFFVTLEGDKLRIATHKDDYILGVVSAAPAMVADASDLRWHNLFAKDEWGKVQYQDVVVPESKDERGQMVIPQYIKQEPVLNPTYDPSQVYVPRMERPEWVIVGLLGKLLVRDDGSCLVNQYCKPNNQGIATLSKEGYRVMKRLIEYWQVPVYAHPLELPYLTGQKNYPEADSSVNGGLIAKVSPFFPNEAIDLGAHVKALPLDGTIPHMDGFRWIHTPGHTPGHISLFRDEDGALIAGDAFVTVKQESLYKVLLQQKEISGPPRYFTTDWLAAFHSVNTLEALKPTIAITGHGVPMMGEELKTNLQKLTNEFEQIALPNQGKYLN